MLMSTMLQTILVVVLACTSADARGVRPVDGDPIVLVYADEYSVRLVDTVSVRELTGRVHLVHGDVTVYCDRATQYPAANTVVLRGSVRIIQGSMTMMMPKGEYDGMRSIATGTGGVRITDRSMDLRAPEAEYHSTTAIVEFADGVTMDDDSMM
ncbi:MAG: OstA-like protein, partial [Candidatus Kapaibacterium sp.]